MADASYVIYLFHPFVATLPPAVLMKLHLVYPALSIGCSIFIGLAVGCIIHRFVEKPTNDWIRDHILARKERALATAL